MDRIIRGVAICRNDPWVSYLFFSDDSVFFCCATEGECQKVLDILAIYERGSSQKINREKTNIFFSTNTPQLVQSQIQHLLGVPTIRQYETYLGLPALVGQAKKRSFIYLKERFGRNHKVGRKGCYLKQVGKCSLSWLSKQSRYIQWVVSKSQEVWSKNLEVLICKFWWGYSGELRKVHWVSWERLCKDKELGGLCCEILKYSQVYKPYQSIVWQEWGQTHTDLNERRKINPNIF